jgi:integrase
MNKTMTVAAVRAYKPGRARREIPDGGCRGLYLVVEPTGRKSWALRHRRPDGRTAKQRLGSVDIAEGHVDDPVIGGHLTLSSARLLATRQLNQLASGKDVIAEHKAARRKMVSTSAATFPGMARAFVEQHLRDRPDRKGNARRNWWKTALVFGLDYDRGRQSDPTVIERSLCDRWATRPVTEITKADVRGVVDEARSQGIPGRKALTKGPSGAREAEMIKAMGGLFDWLLRHRGAIEVDPTATLPGAQAGPARDRVLTDDELVALWRALDEELDPLARVIRLMILTGARRGEVEAMAWSEIDKDRTVWSLPAARSKNKLAHTVALSRQARDLLPPRNAGQFVFSLDGGKRFVQTYGKLKTRLDAKLKFAPWRFHDLRRTAITGMVEIGIEPHVVEAVVNHISGSRAGVAGIYNRSELVEPRRKALERWAAHVDRLLTGERDDNVAELARGRVTAS